MHKSIINLIDIKKKINLKKKDKDFEPKIIAVSKTFPIKDITPLIEFGHIHFGENKVQEAIEKWSDIKSNNKNIKLHMIGKLQSNKVKNALCLFDYIHSLDSLKLAKKISEQQKKMDKKIKLFIQINIGSESQKSGIKVDELSSFYKVCCSELDLNIIGLMCLPPINSEPSKYFKLMKQLSDELSLKELSMGMSADYLEAIEYSASFIRVGSKIFGARI